MTDDRQPHQRRSIRLPEYDYSQEGAYFVTIITQDRKCLFGEVIEREMVLNDVGKMVEQVWKDIPKRFPSVNVDTYMVMPNHIHGIIVIEQTYIKEMYEHGLSSGVRATHASPLQTTRPKGPKPKSIGAIVGSFKSAATNRINKTFNTLGEPVWQRNYYERIVRNEREHQAVYDYILTNPQNWAEDTEYM
jgi:REP element-mobilizing transposase RayT